MKYIVTTCKEHGEEIFVFPRTVNHDTMSEVLSRIRNQSHGNWERISRMPVSAGFVTSSGVCHGRSETLNLDSRKDVDTALLKKSY